MPADPFRLDNPRNVHDQAAWRAPDPVCCAPTFGMARWVEHYRGPIRDGAWPNTYPDAPVYRCSGCGTLRLHEVHARRDEHFTGGAYQASLGEGTHATGMSFEPEVDRVMELLGDVEGKRVVDVGCGDGAFIRHLRSQGATAVGVDKAAPDETGIYPTCGDAWAQDGITADIVTLMFALEYAVSPAELLAEAAAMRADNDAIVVIGTANANDLLPSIAPAFRPFWYRRAQRWTFTEDAIRAMAKNAGLRVRQVEYVQRYDFQNAEWWMQFGEPPPSMTHVPCDDQWRAGLEERGLSDRFYAVLEDA